MNKNISLKQIFTIENLTHFFKYHKKFFANYSSEDFYFIKKSLLASLQCRELGYAKAVFSCPSCSNKVYRPVTCKSRFCTSCGKIYAEKWSLKLSQDLIDRKHRHILFTMPEELWKYPIFNRDILPKLCKHINSMFKNWFNKHKIKFYGLIIAIHTFGRDASFNSHFHVIVSLGGFNQNGVWKKLDFFAPNFFNNSWKYLVLKTIKSFYPRCKKTSKLIDECYKKSFFVNLKGEPFKMDIKSINYIGRYLMRPAIAEYRIIKFENNEVSFWYIDSKTKEKIYLTLPLFKFMGRLIIQIPPKGFKSIRRYGFYARNLITWIKDKIRNLRKKALFKKQILSWSERIYIQYGKHPLVCSNCNCKMQLTSFHHKKYGDYYFP